MSQLPRIVAACALACLCACSGARNEELDNLNTGRKDAGLEPDDSPEAGTEVPQEDASTSELDASTPSADAEAMETSVPGPADAQTSDAGSDPDAGVDAAPAAARYVRVTVTRAGAALKDLAVFFSGVEEQLVDTALTDANGRASTDETTFIVTVLLPPPSSNVRAHLFSFFGVKQGDDLKLDLPSEGGERQELYQFTTPADAPNITRYEAVGGPNGCARGSSVPPDVLLSVGSQPGCLAPSGNTLMLMSSRQISGTNGAYDLPMSYGLVSGLAYPAQGPVSVPFPTLSTIRDVDLSVQNGPANTSVSTALFALLGPNAFPTGVKASANWLLQAGSLEYAVPSFAFDALLSQATYYDGHLTHLYQVRSADSAAPSALDLAKTLPDITAFEVDTGRLNQPQFRWTSAPAAVRDAYLFEGQLYLRGTPELNDTSIRWTGVCGPETEAIRLPPLPSMVLSQIPAESNWEVQRMSEVQNSLIPDYDAFRQAPLHLHSNVGDLIEMTLTAPGEAEVATWDQRG